ncbi:MAG: tetratricopeptide repeat protein, partial [Flammeovirgaceae bacterium]
YIITFFLISPLAFAQNNQRHLIDSLKDVLATQNLEEDTLKAQTLITLGGLYGNINEVDSGLHHLKEGLKIALDQQHSNLIMGANHAIGNLYFVRSDQPNALKHFQDVFQEAQKSGNKNAESMALQRMGKVFEVQEDFQQALEYYNKAYEIEKNRENNASLLALVLNNIGNIYSYLNELPKALDYQLRALEIRKQQNPNNPSLGYSYNDIAFIYSQMDSIDKAIEFYDQALKLLLPLNRKWEISVLSQNIAAAYAQKEQYDIGINYALQGLKAAQEIGSNSSIYSNASTLALLYENKSNINEAYKYLQMASQYRDSIQNEENAKEIGRLESRLELEKKEAENLKKQAVIEQQQQTNIAIGAGLVIALVLAVFLFRGRMLVKRANNELRLSNEQIKQQKEELLTQSETLKEAFEEIQQINEEIQVKHDELNQRNLVIEKKNTNIMSSINYGSRIQNALLPFDQEIAESFNDFFILFKPRNVVSGDFYWFENLGDKQILASVDCTGHGVPGAFMSMLGVGALDDAVLRQGIHEPAKILTRLDQYIQNVLQQEQTENKDGMDMSINVIDRKNQTLTFAGARHALYYFQGDQDVFIKGDRFSIGGLAQKKEKVFTERTIDISQPTTIYVYSDGFPDQFGGDDGRKFMSKKLRSLIASIQTKSMNEQKSILEQTLKEWMGKQRQVDDILIIGMKVS